MTELRKIADNYYLAGQIIEADITAAKALGVTHVICNRPDGEDVGQADVATVSAWAAAQGMTFAHIPMDAAGPTMHSVRATAVAADGDEITLAYCRSGNRSSVLWALAMAICHSMETEDILAACLAAGYDQQQLFEIIDILQME